MPVLRKLLFFGCYGALMGLGIFLLFGPTLRLQKISCTQNGGSCAEEYQNEVAKWRGKSLLFTDFSQDSKQLQKNWPQLQKVSVVKKLPDEVAVELSLGEVKYVTSFADQIFRLVSTQGVVIQEVSATPSAGLLLELPDTLQNEFGVGQKVEEKWQQELSNFVDAVTLNSLMPQRILFSSKNEVELDLANNQKALLLLSEAPVAMPKLVAILATDQNHQLPIKPQIIDLRFKYPVLKADPAASIAASVAATVSATQTPTPQAKNPPSMTPSPKASASPSAQPRR